jgi:hypothetical protein
MIPRRLKGWRKARAAWLHNRGRPPPPKKKRRPEMFEAALSKSLQRPSQRTIKMSNKISPAETQESFLALLLGCAACSALCPLGADTMVTSTFTPWSDRFGLIYADPPWAFSVYSPKGKGRSAEAYYDVMSLADIKAMPVGDWAAENSTLLLWADRPTVTDHV